MSGYLVDTNIPSELTRQQPDSRVADFIRRAGRENLFLSVMTIGEISKGISLLPVSHKRIALENWLNIDVRSWFAGRSLPVTEVIAARWGNLAAEAKKKGITLAVVDGVNRRYCSGTQPDSGDTKHQGLCRSRYFCSQPLGFVSCVSAAEKKIYEVLAARSRSLVHPLIP